MKYYDDEDNENIETNIIDSGEQQEEQQGEPNDWGDQATHQSTPKKPANQMALVSMICGIIALLCVCCCVAFPVAIILGVAAICFSAFSRKGDPFTGQAIAGLVLGILAVIFGVAAGFYLITVNLMMGDPNMAPIFDQIQDIINQSID